MRLNYEEKTHKENRCTVQDHIEASILEEGIEILQSTKDENWHVQENLENYNLCKVVCAPNVSKNLITQMFKPVLYVVVKSFRELEKSTKANQQPSKQEILKIKKS